MNPVKPATSVPTFLGSQPAPYCKGCGHGTVTRKLNEAMVRLGLDASQIVLTSDIGCVGLVDPLFPGIHTVHTIHGRSSAVAAGAVLADGILGDGRMKNVVMIGDGGATIGLLHLSQAALMNVDMTVLLHNNMLYGMTGGQHSAFTPDGFHTSTTPRGNWIPAIDMEHVMRGCQAGYFARKLATEADLVDVIAEAIAYPGFAMIEILELCTGFGVPLNKMDGKALRAMAEARGHALGVLIRRADRRPYHTVYRERFPSGGEPANAKPATAAPDRVFRHRLQKPMTLIVAGSAGEKVQTAGAVLSQAAVLSGLYCVQKNDYPVTVGSGFSLAEVKLSPEPILYTGTDAPDAVLVVSVDGLDEVRGRGDVRRMARDGVLLADESIAAGLGSDRVVSLPLRRELSGDGAALGAVTVMIERSGFLECDALAQAVEVLGGRGTVSMRKTIAAARELAHVAAKP